MLSTQIQGPISIKMRTIKQIPLVILPKIFWITSTLFWLGCSTENSEVLPIRKLDKVSPSTVEIGETVTIDGIGLNCSTCRITFNGMDDYDIISSSETQIVVTMPTQHNEIVSIVLWDKDKPVDTATVNLAGFFPLENLPITHPWDLQSIDEHTFFANNESGLFLTEDGGYHWSQLLSHDYNVRNFFFLTKNMGWVVSSKENSPTLGEYIIYFTNNAGQSFQPIDTVNCYGFLESISEVVFKSPTEGYLLSTKGRIYSTSNNSQFDIVYEFPENTDFTAGFNSLTVYNNTVMSTGEAAIGLSSSVPILIIGKNNIFKFANLDARLGNVQLVGDNEAYLVKADKLFFSNDAGENWTKQSDLVVYDFNFSDKSNGVAITSGEEQLDQTIVFTRDSGLNWELKARRTNISTTCMAFSANVGLIGVYDSYYQMWKYVGK
jgi:photosystem II stability/assembly factor-like uncharacterized protein